jgi:general secretion pathway protein M
MRISSIPAWLPADAHKRRAVAVALLLLAIAVISAAVFVPAVLLHRHYDESIAKLVRQVSTQTTFNALRPRLAEKLESLKSRDVRKLFLKGTTSALALAELQEAVRTAIEANGGRVVSFVQGNALKEEGAYRQVAATFNLNTNNANLRRVLYTLESKEPYLFIDNVVIQPQGYRPAPGTPEPDMFVQLDVRGFALRTASEITPTAAPASSTTTKDKAGAT